MAEENKKVVNAVEMEADEKELHVGDAAQVRAEGEVEFTPPKVAIDPKTGKVISEKELSKEEELDR